MSWETKIRASLDGFPDSGPGRLDGVYAHVHKLKTKGGADAKRPGLFRVCKCGVLAKFVEARMRVECPKCGRAGPKAVNEKEAVMAFWELQKR